MPVSPAKTHISTDILGAAWCESFMTGSSRMSLYPSEKLFVAILDWVFLLVVRKAAEHDMGTRDYPAFP